MKSNRTPVQFDQECAQTLAETDQLVKLEQLFLQSRPPQPLLGRVFNFIENNYRNSISLRDVAEEVERSPAYLTDLVRRVTGKTVLTWITERRMAEARRLLLETNHSVEQITEVVGYFDRRHFSRQFFRFHKLTPHAWRKSNQVYKSVYLQTNQLQAANLTPTEAQRLKVCVKEIAAILYKDTADEILTLENIRHGSILQTNDGSVQVTVTSSLR